MQVDFRPTTAPRRNWTHLARRQTTMQTRITRTPGGQPPTRVQALFKAYQPVEMEEESDID